MKSLIGLLLFSSMSWAANYDQAFHLRHKYNATEKTIKRIDVARTEKIKDPRIGLKNHPFKEEYREMQAQEEAPKK